MFRPAPSYTYADIGIKPTVLSQISSRNNVSTRYSFLGKELTMPILASPMETVTGSSLACAIRNLGGLAVLPRTNNFYDDIDTLDPENNDPSEFIVSIGATGNYIEGFDAFYELGVRRFCVDVANGFNSLIAGALQALHKRQSDIFLIAGNVASWEGYKYLAENGADAVRVGIGGGSVCTTSIATGVGVGQASIVREIAEAREEYTNQPILIADGGIKTPGDVSKAIALGADIVMIGGVLGGTEEAEGHIIRHNGQLYKQIAGQASRLVKGEKRNIEGAEVLVPYIGDLEDMWETYKDGLQSSMAYMNCLTLDEFRLLPNSCFVNLTEAARTERGVHAA